MKPVLGAGRELLEVESIESTQTELARLVREGRQDVAAILAHEQTAGRGRFGRTWHSPAGHALSLSVALFSYADWPQPSLIGMAVALAAAEALDLELAWPNDLMLGGKKLGGVLGELIPDPAGRLIPVAGIGVNLSVRLFPAEIAETATSLALAGRKPLAASEACHGVLEAIERVPEPLHWKALAPLWKRRDRTAGKRYRLPDGRTAAATGIGISGQLIADADGERIEVPSAEALFP